MSRLKPFFPELHTTFHNDSHSHSSPFRYWSMRQTWKHWHQKLFSNLNHSIPSKWWKWMYVLFSPSTCLCIDISSFVCIFIEAITFDRSRERERLFSRSVTPSSECFFKRLSIQVLLSWVWVIFTNAPKKCNIHRRLNVELKFYRKKIPLLNSICLKFEIFCFHWFEYINIFKNCFSIHKRALSLPDSQFLAELMYLNYRISYVGKLICETKVSKKFSTWLTKFFLIESFRHFCKSIGAFMKKIVSK